MMGYGQHAHEFANPRGEVADLQLPIAHAAAVLANGPIDSKGLNSELPPSLPGMLPQPTIQEPAIFGMAGPSPGSNPP